MKSPRTSKNHLPPTWGRHPAATLVAGLLLIAGASSAQQPTSATSTVPADETVVELSPFEVNTEQDEGFVASTALTGGRLALDMKDTPVAYSVITRDFIDALGITDLVEAAEWTTNTQKFADGAGNGGDFWNITAPITVRGLAASAQLRQRNFFIYYAPMDSYNLERFDFGRGPNAVLFGNGGTLGGTQTSTTKRARFDREFGSLELSYGSWNNFRSVIDYNRPLNDRIALRFAAVYGDRDGWVDWEMEKTQAAFLTSTFKLTDKTELRVEAEKGHQDRRIPSTDFRDRFTGWDGVTWFDGPMTNAMRAGTVLTPAGTRLTFNGSVQGVDRRGSNYIVHDPFSGVDAIMNYQNDPFTRGGDENADTPIAGFSRRDAGNVTFNTRGQPFLHAFDRPDGEFDNALDNSHFVVPSDRFSVGMDTPLIEQNFRDIQATLSHQFGDSFFVELAASSNEVKNIIRLEEGRGLKDTFIDINRTLPNGAPNPHFLHPYGDGTYWQRDVTTSVDSARFAVAYRQDAGRWGNYSASLMGGTIQYEQSNANSFLSLARGSEPRQWGNPDQGLRVRQYWYEPDRSYRPPEGPITFIDPIAGTTEQVTPYWAPNIVRADDNNLTENTYNYLQSALVSKFFDDRLIVIGAARYDDFETKVPTQLVQGDYPTDWDGRTVLFRPDAPANYWDLRYTPVDSNGNPIGDEREATNRPRLGNGLTPDPLYDGIPFRSDYNAPAVTGNKVTLSYGAVYHFTRWLTGYYNYAESYSLPISTPRIDWSILPPVEGDGWDAGVRFNLLQNKLNLSVGYYENERTGDYVSNESVVGPINSLYDANHYTDNSEFGRNQRGIAPLPGVVRDFRDQFAEGWEIEGTANLTKGWRMTLGVGIPKIYEQANYPDTTQYLAVNGDAFVQVLQDAGGMIDTSQSLQGAPGRAVANPNITPARSQDRDAAVSNYNLIYERYAGLVTGGQKRMTQDQPNLNLYTDYQFQEGPLKGFRAGLGVRWRDKQIVGNRSGDRIADPADPTRSIDDPSVDSFDLVYSPTTDTTVTATFFYRIKLAERRTLDLNLRIDNLLDDDDVIYQSGSTTLRPINGDYTSAARETVPVAYALKRPRSFYLTAKLSF